jgi:hypothetical protein
MNFVVVKVVIVVEVVEVVVVVVVVVVVPWGCATADAPPLHPWPWSGSLKGHSLRVPKS